MVSATMSKTRVFFIGIGGASSAGKSTVAKHLGRILANSVIIHQDDFVPPPEKLPFHPIHQVQDWDAPATAIDWTRFINFLRKVKADGSVPADHQSYEHLNQNPDVPMDDGVRDRWTQTFKELQNEKGSQGEKIAWVIIDGFLLYWKPEVLDLLDVRVLVRAPEQVLEERRRNRQWYSADGSSADGTFVWRDPPGYWQNIVWPAYVEAHEHLFVSGDVENGGLGSNVKGLILLETLKITMTEAVDLCCSIINRAVAST